VRFIEQVSALKSRTSRLQDRKIVNPTFSGEKTFFPQQFN